MSSVETRKFEPATGTAGNLGANGDAVTLPAGVTLKTNTIKDAGGNTIFTSDGAGTLSSVNSGLQGNMVFISSQTASGSASLEFTSGIDSTYDEYVFYFVNINPASDVYNFGFQVNTSYNQSITSTFFRALHAEDDSSASLGYDDGRDLANSTSYCQLCGDPGGGSDESMSGAMHLFGPSSTTYVKQFYAVTSVYRSDDKMVESFIGGYINTTSAVDKVGFKMNSGNFDGTIYLYGIK